MWKWSGYWVNNGLIPDQSLGFFTLQQIDDHGGSVGDLEAESKGLRQVVSRLHLRQFVDLLHAVDCPVETVDLLQRSFHLTYKPVLVIFYIVELNCASPWYKIIVIWFFVILNLSTVFGPLHVLFFDEKTIKQNLNWLDWPDRYLLMGVTHDELRRLLLEADIEHGEVHVLCFVNQDDIKLAVVA